MSEWSVRAIIMPKPGVNDPQGEAIRSGLESLEFSGVREVRAGKQIALRVVADSEQEAVAKVDRMCEQLLSNPVIETYSVFAEPVAVNEGASVT